MPSPASPTEAAELALEVRAIRERLQSIAQSLAVLRAEIDEALTSDDASTAPLESDPGRHP